MHSYTSGQLRVKHPRHVQHSEHGSEDNPHLSQPMQHTDSTYLASTPRAKGTSSKPGHLRLDSTEEHCAS
ncbi:MAG: hypothetical protein SOW66_06485 [Porphyromonas sp.]|nr:hypothetical protein [Porphyromonas sp.]